MNVTSEMATVAIGAVGLYKIFEPIFFRLLNKKNQQEKDIIERLGVLEKKVNDLQVGKVDWKDHNKMLASFNDKFMEITNSLSLIKGILEGKKEEK